MNAPFSQRHVVVTGGTGALGTAVVKRLLAAGAICHVPCLIQRELDSFAFADHPQVHCYCPIDLTVATEVADFYTNLPPLWASIHCAGGFDMAPIADTEPAAYRRLMAMNADSCFLCCRAAVASIRRSEDGEGRSEDGEGRIVNIAARPALEPRTGASMVAYTMAKSAVAALTLALSEELADERIWVNAVAPSIIDTAANRAAMPDADHDAWPKVDELAESIVFLASPDNRVTRASLVPVYGRS